MAPVYTEEEVDALLKQVDVAVSKVKEYRHKVVKLRSAEANLLELYEKTRLMIHDFLKNPDREDLIKVFGGDCRRIAKLLIALDYDFSEMYAPDPRPSSLKKTVESLEAVLNDKGFCQAIREAKVSEETARERGETMFHESTITKANQLLASLGCDHAEMVPVGRLPPVAWNFASGESERLAEFTVCDPKLEQASIQEQNPSSAEPGFSPEAQPGQLVPGAVAGNPALPPSQGPGCEPAKPSVTLPAGEGSRVVQTEVAQPGQSTVAQPSGGGYGGKDVPLVPSPFLTDSTRADVPGSEGTLGQGGPCSAPAEAGQTLPLVHGVIQDLGETRTILTPIVSQEAQAYTLHSGLQSVPEGPVSHPSVASAPGRPVSHPSVASAPGGPVNHPSVASAPGGPVNHPSVASAPGGPVNHPSVASAPGGPVNHPSVASAPGGPISHPSVASALGGLVSHPSAASAPGGPVSHPSTASALGGSVFHPSVASAPGGPVSHPSVASAQTFSAGGPALPQRRVLNFPPSSRTPASGPPQSQGLHFDPNTEVPERAKLVGVDEEKPVSSQRDRSRASVLLQNGDTRSVGQKTFDEVVATHGQGGRLTWNNRGIPTFLTRAFQNLDLEPPPERAMYAAYTNFDRDSSWSMDVDECTAIVEKMLVSLYGFSVGDPHKQIVERIKTGEVGRVAADIFRECDVSKCGSLRWNDGEVRHYILRVLKHFGLPSPSESNMYALFHTYDSDMNHALDIYESKALVETLCRANYTKASDDVMKCRQGHEMALFTAQQGGANCQSCGTAIRPTVLFWHCAACRYVECVACSKKNRTQ